MVGADDGDEGFEPDPNLVAMVESLIGSLN
jgi:hypothetical protein